MKAERDFYVENLDTRLESFVWSGLFLLSAMINIAIYIG